MFKIDNISEGLTESIKKNLPVDDVKAEQIEYGIYMFISEVIKVSAILIISAVLGILKYSLLSILVFGAHRGFIGGVHAKTHWGCFLSYSAIIFGTVYLSMYVSVNMYVLCLIVYPICMAIAYKYAPADNLNKPIVSKKQKHNLRIGGFTFITIVFTVSLFTVQPYANILVCITLAECITMLPAVYKITGNQYGRKEVDSYAKENIG